MRSIPRAATRASLVSRAVTAGVHGQGAADGPRDAGVELQAGDPRLGRGASHGAVQGRRAGGHPTFFRLDRRRRRPAGQANHHAFDAAVADDDVGADAQHRDRNLRRQGRQERRQIVLVGGKEQRLGRSADPEPGEGRQRLVEQQPAAHRRQAGAPTGRRSPPRFRHPASPADPAGRAPRR